MIKLTRLDGANIFINEKYIESIEATPDTKINLHNGTTYVVQETPEQILKKIIDWSKKNKK